MFEHFVAWWLSKLWLVSCQVIILLIAIRGFLWLCKQNITANFYYCLWCLLLIRLCFPVHFVFQMDCLPQVCFATLPTYENTVIIKLADIATSNVDVQQQATIPTKEEWDIQTIFIKIWIAVVVAIFALFLIRRLVFYYKLGNKPKLQSGALFDFIEELRHEMGIKGNIDIYIDDDGPYTTGLWKPKLVLPSFALEWSNNDLKPIIAHELNHILRKDLWGNELQNILQILYFFHPLVWFINSQIRQQRELACDEKTVQSLHNEYKHYCQIMLRLATQKTSLFSSPLIATLINRQTLLEKRIKYMLGSEAKSSNKTRTCTALGIFVFFLIPTIIAQESTTQIHHDLNAIFRKSTTHTVSNWSYVTLKAMLLDIPGVHQVDIDVKNALLRVDCLPTSALQVKKILARCKKLQNRAYSLKGFLYSSSQNNRQANIAVTSETYEQLKKQLAKVNKTMTPRMTFYHGQVAHIVVANKITYIKKYLGVNKKNVAEPQIENIQAGLDFKCSIFENVYKNELYLKIHVNITEVVQPIPLEKQMILLPKQVVIQMPKVHKVVYKKEIVFANNKTTIRISGIQVGKQVLELIFFIETSV